MIFPILKVGDIVLRHHDREIIRGGYGTGLTVRVVVEEVVARVTAKQAVTESGLRFTLEDGTIHQLSKGVRVRMYPVGYVNNYGRNAIECKPLEATDPRRLEQIDKAADAAYNLERVYTRFERHQSHIIKHVLNSNGLVAGATVLRDATLAIEKLMEGFKP